MLRNIFATTVAFKIISFAALFIAVRIFNDSQYSSYSILIGVSSFVATYANWGISTLFWKEKKFRENYAAELLIVQSFLACIALPLIFAFFYFKRDNIDVLPAMAMLLCSIPLLININITTKVRESNPKLLPVVILSLPLCEALSLISSYFLFRITPFSNLFYSYAYTRLLFLSISVLCINNLSPGKLFKPAFEIIESVRHASINSIFRVFNEGFSIVVVNIAAVAYTTFDKLIINIVLGPSSAANYAFSATLGLALPALLTSTNRIYIGPERELNSSCKVTAKRYETNIKKVFDTATIFVFAGVFLIFFFLPPIMKLSHVYLFNSTIAALFFIAGTNSFVGYFNAVSLVDNSLSGSYSLMFIAVNFVALSINAYLLNHGATEKTSAFIYFFSSLAVLVFGALLLFIKNRKKDLGGVFKIRVANLLPYVLATLMLAWVLSI
jgi:O-antigen/teichoic acid export membrane protein